MTNGMTTTVDQAFKSWYRIMNPDFDLNHDDMAEELRYCFYAAWEQSPKGDNKVNTKVAIELSEEGVDHILEQAMVNDANLLWEYVSRGDAVSYQYLEALKTYMQYCGVSWTPPVEISSMDTYG